MNSPLPRPLPARRLPAREDGVVAIIIALVLAMLLGFGGVVLDLGHLFVNKTELQNAADACALAAAGQLACDPAGGTGCPASFLADAEAAGIFVGSRNASNFQKGAVVIAPADVLFHTAIGPIGSFKSRADGANANSKFAMCIARSAGIKPWLMQAKTKVDPAVVQAFAVATLAPGQTACNASPIGVCMKPGGAAPSYGYGIGEWIVGTFNGSNNGDDANLAGSFRWVDFTPNGGGTNEVSDQLLGRGSVCGISVGDDVAEQGIKQGAKSAWNTRFGIYQNGANQATPASVAPDKTGYAYPSKAPGTVINIGQSAYTDYRSKQAAHAAFDTRTYAPSGAAGNVKGTPLSSADHLAFGAERRIIPVPVLECGKASAKILSMGCVLMLNPMSNGSTGNIYLEWRGPANAPGSPCRSAGVAGGTTGALVPTLVQ